MANCSYQIPVVSKALKIPKLDIPMHTRVYIYSPRQIHIVLSRAFRHPPSIVYYFPRNNRERHQEKLEG